MEQPKITPLTERQNVSRALGGTDALGREISPAGETNGKLVGIFYVLWLGNDYSDEGTPYFDGIYDMSKMDFNEIYSGSGSPFLKCTFTENRCSATTICATHGSWSGTYRCSSPPAWIF